MIINPRRALLLSLALLVGFGVLAVLVAVPSTLRGVQVVDDAVHRGSVSLEWGPLIWLAKAFSFIGGTKVNWPVRVLVLVVLAGRRRWLQLAAFALAILTSELLIGPLKVAYGRARPPHSLIATSGGSFPSGHAIAGAVTAVGLVLVLVAPGAKRWRWEVWAIGFATCMALSRVYLSAHWLSDVVAGALLGGGLALGWPAALQLFRERVQSSRRTTGSAADQPPSPPSEPAVGGRR
ncbi:MAG: hypothetical protein QOJ32_1918 [Frankiaceae bacterium]|nr:hypothetical protein [Frankiaceae bacterium]MDQ1635109.1 hypothetical protein [Frankiaceae bacterium]